MPNTSRLEENYNKKISRKGFSIGKIKALIDRQRNYISILNFFMLAYLFFEKVGFKWYYLSIIPLFIVWAWIDATYIMPKELDYVHRKSPVLKELLKKNETIPFTE